MEKLTDFNGIFLYFVFLLIVIFGLLKWIIDLLESIKELKTKNVRLNFAHNFEAKEYLKLQKEFEVISDLLDKVTEKNVELKKLLKTQEEIINDLSKTD